MDRNRGRVIISQRGRGGGGGGRVIVLVAVRRALPPEGWQSTVLHEPHSTTVCACEKTCRARVKEVSGEGEG